MALLVLLFLAPLPFGCIEDWSRWLLVTVLGLCACFFLWAGIPLRLGRRERVAVGLLGGLVLWMGIQMLPLPPSLLAAISPGTHALYATAVPGYASTDPRGYAVPVVDDAAPEGSSPTWASPSFSRWRSLSLHPYDTYRVFWQTAALGAFFLMGLSLFRQDRHRFWLVSVLIAVGVFQAVYGSLETLTGHEHIFAYEKRYYVQNATGTLINRNHFAGMINMAIPLALAMGLGLEPHRSLRWRRLLLGAAVAMGIGVVLSRSRMGIAVMILGLLASAFLVYRWQANRAEVSPAARSRWALLLPVALVPLIGLVSVGLDPGGTFERFLTVTRDLQPGATRPALWQEGWTVLRSFPMTGVGAGAYAYGLNPNLSALPLTDFWIYDHAHNDYIESTATLGMPGLLLGLGALMALILRRPGSLPGLAAQVGILTLILHSATDFLVSIPSNALLACALLLLVTPPTEDTAEAPRHRDGRRRPRGRALLTGFAVALVALWPTRALAAAMVYRPHWHHPFRLPEVSRALSLASFLEPRNDFYLRRLAAGKRDRTLRSELGEVDLGGEFQRQVRAWQTQRMRDLLSAHRLLLETLDLSPVDYSLHAEIGELSASIRDLAVTIDLPPPQGDAFPAVFATPQLTSAALAPTAYRNFVEIGARLWQEREALGDGVATAALEVLKRAVGHHESGYGWLSAVVRSTHDTASLSRLDSELAPHPSAYAPLLVQRRQDSPDVPACAKMLWLLAEVREATKQAVEEGPDAPADRLRRARERVDFIARSLAVTPTYPAGAPGPCGDARSHPLNVAEDLSRFEESLDAPVPP